MLHWDGGAWSAQDIGTPNVLFALAGGGTDVWAVGAGGTMLRRGP